MAAPSRSEGRLQVSIIPNICDEAAADIVRRIFTMAENGWGFVKIAKTLQAEGIPNPQSYADGTHDTRWHITSVQKILQNPVYCGDCVQGRRGNRTMHRKTKQCWRYMR